MSKSLKICESSNEKVKFKKFLGKLRGRIFNFCAPMIPRLYAQFPGFPFFRKWPFPRSRRFSQVPMTQKKPCAQITLVAR